MIRTCTDCSSPISHVSRGRCRSCAAKARYSDPAARRVMSEAKKRALLDPVKRERVSSTASTNLRQWHKTTTKDWSAHHRARAATARSWCPVDRWDDYVALRRQRGVGAERAKAMIIDEMARAERKRIAALSPFERDMERLRNGAGLVAAPDFRTSNPDFTIGGIASASL